MASIQGIPHLMKLDEKLKTKTLPQKLEAILTTEVYLKDGLYKQDFVHKCMPL